MPISLAALALILAASLGFSALDLLRKQLAGSIAPQPLLVLIAIGASPVFYLWMRVSGASGAGPGYWGPGLAVVLINIAANLFFLQAVRVSPLSATIPFLSLTPVFTTILAIPMLGEWPRWIPAAGVVFVVLGAFTLNLGGGLGGAHPSALWRSYRQERGSVLMTLVAFLWSLAAPLDKLAVQASSPAFHGLIANFGVGLGVLLLMIVGRRVGEIARGAKRWGLLALSIVAGFVALACFLEAIQRMPIGLAETLKRAVGSFAALGSGALFFGEQVGWRHATSVALMAIGVAMLLLG